MEQSRIGKPSINNQLKAAKEKKQQTHEFADNPVLEQIQKRRRKELGETNNNSNNEFED